MKNKRSIATLLVGCFCLASAAQAGWKKDLSNELPLMGHRNWVVVADSAYPLQTAPGIKTIYAGGDHVEVLKQVLEVVSGQKHVRPVIFTDAELKHVDEKYAPGIGALRQQLQDVLADCEVQVLPYTSGFIRLDCGYWSAEAEKALRDAMQ